MEIKSIREETERTPTAGTMIALCLVVTEEAVREAKDDRSSHQTRYVEEDSILTKDGVASLRR